MTVIFNDADLISAYKQQRNLFRIYWIITFIFFLICLSSLLYYISLPFEDPMQILPKIIVCTASCIFIIFSYLFLGIKYHRARKYYRIISYLSVGLKQVNQSYFLRYEQPELRDGVDFYVIIMSEWNKKKSEYMDRKIYSDKEKVCPKFEPGDQICYLTQGNVIVEYEIISHDEHFLDKIAKQDQHR